MSAAAPMERVAKVGRFQLYVARRGRRFTRPGLHLWTGHRHRWVLPLAWPTAERRRAT